MDQVLIHASQVDPNLPVDALPELLQLWGVVTEHLGGLPKVKAAPADALKPRQPRAVVCAAAVELQQLGKDLVEYLIAGVDRSIQKHRHYVVLGRGAGQPADVPQELCLSDSAAPLHNEDPRSLHAALPTVGKACHRLNLLLPADEGARHGRRAQLARELTFVRDVHAHLLGLPLEGHRGNAGQRHGALELLADARLHIFAAEHGVPEGKRLAGQPRCRVDGIAHHGVLAATAWVPDEPAVAPTRRDARAHVYAPLALGYVREDADRGEDALRGVAEVEVPGEAEHKDGCETLVIDRDLACRPAKVALGNVDHRPEQFLKVVHHLLHRGGRLELSHEEEHGDLPVLRQHVEGRPRGTALPDKLRDEPEERVEL
mmetsp:Transcript_35054/g.83155  ORF Transcript_35054/g.83155 Transcript_35054/m.83155 type:complete len:373 (-) Transcript_35054:1761-2879(-)